VAQAATDGDRSSFWRLLASTNTFTSFGKLPMDILENTHSLPLIHLQEQRAFLELSTRHFGEIDDECMADFPVRK
jgi:hypothetical protein